MSLHLTELKDRVEECYQDEVNQTIKEYVNDLKIRQTIINAKKNM